jgi:hypothetical protein
MGLPRPALEAEPIAYHQAVGHIHVVNKAPMRLYFIVELLDNWRFF